MRRICRQEAHHRRGGQEPAGHQHEEHNQQLQEPGRPQVCRSASAKRTEKHSVPLRGAGRRQHRRARPVSGRGARVQHRAAHSDAVHQAEGDVRIGARRPGQRLRAGGADQRHQCRTCGAAGLRQCGRLQCAAPDERDNGGGAVVRLLQAGPAGGGREAAQRDFRRLWQRKSAGVGGGVQQEQAEDAVQRLGPDRRSRFRCAAGESVCGHDPGEVQGGCDQESARLVASADGGGEDQEADVGEQHEAAAEH